MKPQQIVFFQTRIFYSQKIKRIAKKNQLFWHYLNICEKSKLKTNLKMRTISIFSEPGLILYEMK